MSTRRRRELLIPVTIGEDYQTTLARRLDEYGITRRALAAEMQLDPTSLSRWLRRPSAYTGKGISIGMDNVVKIETAIVKILERREREQAKEK